jgi:hypothetical protein
VTVLTFWGGQPWGFRGSNLCKNHSSGPNNNIQNVSISDDLTFFNENIFYLEKAAILKVYFRKSLISTVIGNFPEKICTQGNFDEFYPFLSTDSQKILEIYPKK